MSVKKKEEKVQDKLAEKKDSCRDSLKEALDKKEKEYNELKDKYLRLYAEFDNARKRWEREKEEVIKFANFSLLKELIVILDEIEQGLKIVKEHPKIDEIYKGLEIMRNNFFNILKKRGLKKIGAKDAYFDPHLHEIIATRELEDNSEKPKILEEIQSGYPAKVIVGIKKKNEVKKENNKEKEQQKEG
jgi:molecular chaperone GrpE